MSESDAVRRRNPGYGNSEPRSAHRKNARARWGSGVRCYGGGAGIRTLVTGVTGETVFETAAFSRSATLPRMIGAKPRMKRASGARE